MFSVPVLPTAWTNTWDKDQSVAVSPVNLGGASVYLGTVFLQLYPSQTIQDTL